MHPILNYVNTNKSRFITELSEFLSYKSVSTDPSFKADVDDCADFVITLLTQIGFPTIKRYPTQGHAVVYAEWIHNPSLPTVLFYGHYDVQPADPYDLWITPPFEPAIREGQIIARGASDDKGQVMCHLKAIETLVRTNGTLPVNVKVIIEGEEEIGSRNLYKWVMDHQEMLSADVLVVSDTPMIAEDTPSLSIGLRGLIYFELTVTTANTDLHSGQHGGAVPNAITELVQILSKLKTEDGIIQVPGIYESVHPISPQLKAELDKIPHSDALYQQELGTKACPGEPGFSSLERRWFRPTLDINGIWGGYMGVGAKTVIPCKASAKISMRLVHHQNPKEITQKLMDYLKQITPSYVDLDITDIKADFPSNPFIADITHPSITTACNAIEWGFGKKPVLQGEGGSVPIVSFIQSNLGIPAVLMGFNLPYDNIHAPNEQFSLDRYIKGILTISHFLTHFKA